MKRVLTAALVAILCSCGGDDADEPLFVAKPECEGEAVEALAGQHAMVIQSLQIAGAMEGFDLDRDGEPDNQLAVLGSLAEDPINTALENFEIVVPMEFFDMAEPAADSCVKFAVYVGKYRLDRDMDGALTVEEGGDCNDHSDAIAPGLDEVPDNRIDDDCDGLADETIVDVPTDGGVESMEVPSDDDTDMDGDEVSLADGDCDDTLDTVAPGKAEVCGDGLDNDCDGVADYTVGAEEPVCSPFDDELDPVSLDDSSFDESGNPDITFLSGEVTEEDGKLILRAGPAFFPIKLPIASGVEIDLGLTGATIEAELIMTPGGWAITNGKLGGVLDARTADQIRGLTVDELGLEEQDSLLDAIFANALGALIGLPVLNPDAGEGAGCHTPDIDVDRDGLEAFCDASDDNVLTVDKCVDGDQTVVMDAVDGDGMVTEHCTEAVDDAGEPRFVDGISALIKFESVPAVLPESL